MSATDLGHFFSYCLASYFRRWRIRRGYRNDKVTNLVQTLSHFPYFKLTMIGIIFIISCYFLRIPFQYSCAPDWKALDSFGRFYNWYLMTCGFFVPTTIVLVSNVLIMNASRKVKSIDKMKK